MLGSPENNVDDVLTKAAMRRKALTEKLSRYGPGLHVASRLFLALAVD